MSGKRRSQLLDTFNPSTPNNHYSWRTAPLISKRCILYIYSTNIVTEYFKHGINYQSFSLQNAVRFIILTNLVPVLFTFYIQGVLNLKKNNSGAKRLRKREMLEIERENTKSPCIGNSLWKRLQTCRKTGYEMNKQINVGRRIRQLNLIWIPIDDSQIRQ